MLVLWQATFKCKVIGVSTSRLKCESILKVFSRGLLFANCLLFFNFGFFEALFLEWNVLVSIHDNQPQLPQMDPEKPEKPGWQDTHGLLFER